MNIEKIQRLSKQHADLARFHKVCNRNGVELTATDSETSIPGITLDYSATRLIISAVRVSLLKEMGELEKDIIKEAQDG